MVGTDFNSLGITSPVLSASWPRRSKYSTFEASGPNNHSLNGFWSQKPQMSHPNTWYLEPLAFASSSEAFAQKQRKGADNWFKSLFQRRSLLHMGTAKISFLGISEALCTGKFCYFHSRSMKQKSSFSDLSHVMLDACRSEAIVQRLHVAYHITTLRPMYIP